MAIWTDLAGAARDLFQGSLIGPADCSLDVRFVSFEIEFKLFTLCRELKGMVVIEWHIQCPKRSM